MALELSLLKKKDRTGKKLAKGRIPTKRYINFMESNKKSMKWYVALPILILIIAAAAVFGKFGVADKLDELAKREGELAAARKKLDDGNKEIESFGELAELYGHYTYSGMTNEEVTRADRIAIIDLLKTHVVSNASLGAWNVKGNRLTVYITDDSLQSINLIAQELEQEPMVDYCTLITASTDERDTYGGVGSDDPSTVTAQVTVYLILPENGGAD